MRARVDDRLYQKASSQAFKAVGWNYIYSLPHHQQDPFAKEAKPVHLRIEMKPSYSWTDEALL